VGVKDGDGAREGVIKTEAAAFSVICVGSLVGLGWDASLLARTMVVGSSRVGVKVDSGRNGVRVAVPFSILFGVG
jgi:hypothetical protein